MDMLKRVVVISQGNSGCHRRMTTVCMKVVVWQDMLKRVVVICRATDACKCGKYSVVVEMCSW